MSGTEAGSTTHLYLHTNQLLRLAAENRVLKDGAGKSKGHFIWSHLFVCLFIYFILRATPVVNGSSETGDQIRATAASLHHRQGNMGSEPHL